MNYFPFHLGDYAAHTGHLEPMEDLAYRRLLDQYYLREGPLPDDVEKLAKLIRLRPNMDAVQSVLDEFFVKCPEGWRHKRCDDEIASMQAKQAASEERDEHEKTRQQKHRERRAALFAQLADAGVYPAWNAKTAELERLIDEHCTRPVTAPVTQPVTGLFPNEKGADSASAVTALVTPATSSASPVTLPATAIPTPTPTPTPTPLNISPDLLPESEPLSEFAIPLIDGTDFKVPERTVDEWTRAYPAVDVPQELREMRTWALANKAKRKTRRGIEAFVVRWLGKAQDTPSRAGYRPAADDWTGRAT